MRAATVSLRRARAARRSRRSRRNLFERDRLATEPGDDPIVAAARIVAQADRIRSLRRASRTASRRRRCKRSRSNRVSRSGACGCAAIGMRASTDRCSRFRGPKREAGCAAVRIVVATRYVLIDPTKPVEPVRVDERNRRRDRPVRVRLPAAAAGAPDRRFGISCASGCATAASTRCRFSRSASLGGILAGMVPLATAILYGIDHSGRDAPAVADDGFALLAVALTAVVTEIVRGLDHRAASGASRHDAAVGGHGAAAGTPGFVLPPVRDRRSRGPADGDRWDRAIR